MALFGNKEKNGLELYQVRCTECGGLIENKFFPLDNLLNQYYVDKSTAAGKAQVIHTLGVGALYGQHVLPAVPPLMRKEGQDYELDLPDPKMLKSLRQSIQCFECETNQIPESKLTSVSVNISAIVAQFYLMTGFDTIYYMLKLQKEYQELKQEGMNTGDVMSQLERYCDLFVQIPGVRLPTLAVGPITRSAIQNMLSAILKCAMAEADEPKRRHFALKELRVGWRYKMENGRRMPLSLVVLGNSAEDTYHCNDCCCDKCRKSVSYLMGAYEQKIIGILGSQATGKTTYLAALTDAIDRGEVTAITRSNGDQLRARMGIEHSIPGDPQWIRAETAADDAAGTEGGLMWMYQNGYPPRKTDAQENEAPALTFLVSRDISDKKSERVMYTLADIPGEAFYNPGNLSAEFMEKLRRLLYCSTALIMVISSRQLLTAAKAEEEERLAMEAGDELPPMSREDVLVKNPGAILGAYKGFLPSKSLPTAVVMTSADEINGGDLRQPLQLAFDIRNCPPLVWSGSSGTLVYNAEILNAGVHAVTEYLNRNFGVFMANLGSVLKTAGGKEPVKLAAFAVSNGTQRAPKTYEGTSPEERADHKLREKIHADMCEARFGVATPLLWLLACDGMLEIGRAESQYNKYPRGTQKQIQKKLKESLHN